MFRKKLTINQINCKDIDYILQNVQKNGNSPWAQVRILVVDDQEFAYTDGLQREYGFNVRWMKDISPDQAKDFDIILCDQEGVGQALSKHAQGGALAKEIKERFPLKFVVLYTSSGKALGNTNILKIVDDAISPGADLDDFAQTLKGWCAEVINPQKSWIKLRAVLLEKGVSIHDVADMEDSLVRSWNNNPKNICLEMFGHMTENVMVTLLTEFVSFIVKNSVPLFTA